MTGPLDLAQHGLVSTSCGPHVLRQYQRLTARFAFFVRPGPVLGE